MRLSTSLPNKASRSVRTFVYAQIMVQAGIALTPFWSPIVMAAAAPQDSTLNTTASVLSTVGQASQSNALSGLASQQATGVATQQLQQWLNSFGTARVELGTDNHFKPHTGAVDFLLPLYKSDSRLLFTQNGMRNTDGQFTGNFGVGQRHFGGSWMLGYNAFYDQNFSRGHKRAGISAEAWRDYMKLSGNGYYRLSGWRNSRDLEDYDARPANGFDLRAESWLPAYPSLGGRLMYEQYYGDEVALFGKDSRQKNPNAVTAGMSWTPVPLISFTADHKKGGSQHETLFGLQLSYQLGQPLSAQLDASSVGIKRTLAGSGMDLVDRNNNIVLEYRKQQVIELTLPKEITGQSGSTQPIIYKLASKYGLEKIIWNDAAIIASGGKIEDLGAGRYQLIMPGYVAGGANTHTLSGVAYDVRGNASKTASMTVTVTRPAISAKNSTTVAAKEILIADGKATSLVTVTLRDEQNQPVSGLTADLATAVSEQADATVGGQAKKAKATQAPMQPATLSAITEESAGIYTFTLTAATRPAMAIVTPSLDKLKLTSVSIKQISDAASAVVREGDLKLTSDHIVANGSAKSTVQARVTDATGNPVANVTVKFALSGSARVSPDSSLTGVSDQNGYVTLQFTDTIAEIVTLTAQTDLGGSAQVQATFIADSSTAGLANGSLAADRSTAIANGVDKITYTVKVQDANNNPVSGVAVNWQTDTGNLSSASSNTDDQGIAPITLTSTVATQATVSASLNGSSLSAQPVNFTADSGQLDPAQSSLRASEPSIVADGSTGSVITLTLKDRNGNLVSGQPITMTSSLAGSQLGDVTEVGEGIYTATLTGTKAGTAAVSVTIGGVPFGVATADVVLTADSNNLDTAKSSLKATPATIVANNSDSALITFTLKDVNDNLVAGQEVAFISSLSGSALSEVKDNGNGTYVASLTGTQSGNADISVKVNGLSFAVAAASVTLTADSSNLDATKSSFSGAPATIVADGTAAATLTLTLKDRNDNLVGGQNVVFTPSLTGSQISNVTDSNGTYTALLSGTTAGTEQVTVTVNNTNFAITPVAVTLIGDINNLDETKSSLTASPVTIVANDSDASDITLVLRDKNNNPVNNASVSFDSTLTGSSIGTVNSGLNGTYTAKLTSKKSGSASISVNIDGKAFAVTTATVTINGDASTAKVVSVTAADAQIIGNDVDSTTISATIHDANDNILSGYTVAWKTSASSVSEVTTTTDSNGVAEVTLKPVTQSTTAASSATITAATVGDSSTKDTNVRIINTYVIGGKTFWTQNSFARSDVESVATASCQQHGGTVAKRAELQAFISAGGDFKTRNNTSDASQEYSNIAYNLPGEWGVHNVDLNSVNTGPAFGNGLGRSYVCVK